MRPSSEIGGRSMIAPTSELQLCVIAVSGAHWRGNPFSLQQQIHKRMIVRRKQYNSHPKISSSPLQRFRCGVGYIGEGGDHCAGGAVTLPYVGFFAYFLVRNKKVRPPAGTSSKSLCITKCKLVMLTKYICASMVLV